MNKNVSLNRTCLSCGLEKPLAAFLQISGEHGTMYGNLCSNCRGSSVKTVTLPTTESDDDSKSKGIRIDTKAKIQAEIEHKKQAKKMAEENKLQLEQKDKVSSEKEKKKVMTHQLERDHREEYIEAKKKAAFLGIDKKINAEQVRKMLDKKLAVDASISTEKQHLSAGEQREFDRQTEYRITTLDLAIPFLDPQVANLLVQSPTFIQFRNWLGSNAPIMRTLDLLYNQNAKLLGKANIETPQLSKEQDVLVDFANKTFGPSKKP